MTSLIERYRGGEAVEVWQELIAQDDAVRHGDLQGEAIAIAKVAMARVRTNVERLIERLDALGYRFLRRDAALTSVAPTTDDLIAHIEAIAGPLPLAVAAFYRHIGEIDLRGQLAAWEPPGPLAPGSPLIGIGHEGHAYTDPLVVPPLADLADELFARADELADVTPDEALLLAFSGDALAKHDGPDHGGLYGILLPDPAFDTDLEAHTATTFGDYLRDALRWGGFPGWATYADPPVDQIEALRADFEVF
ncbi:MAG: hypothetical protein KAI47_25770 [Deltaproteobacteria bacterium]|nr:hypothetical protein [Deltaproteobacteria bacterium]